MHLLIECGVTLKTEILTVAPGVRLMPVSVSDALALSTLIAANLDHLMPKVVRLHTFESARDYLTCVVEANGKGDLLEWHLMDGDVLCGAIRLNHIEKDCHKTSIGYYLGTKYLGRGLATAAVQTVLRFVFERLNFNRVELRCASHNAASQRLAKRLGFSWEGMLRQAELIGDTYVDHYVYSLLRSEFDTQGASPASSTT